MVSATERACASTKVDESDIGCDMNTMELSIGYLVCVGHVTYACLFVWFFVKIRVNRSNASIET